MMIQQKVHRFKTQYVFSPEFTVVKKVPKFTSKRLYTTSMSPVKYQNNQCKCKKVIILSHVDLALPWNASNLSDAYHTSFTCSSVLTCLTSLSGLTSFLQTEMCSLIFATSLLWLKDINK